MTTLFFAFFSPWRALACATAVLLKKETIGGTLRAKTSARLHRDSRRVLREHKL